MSENNEVSAGVVLLSFLTGAAVGAGIALLYAPKSGSEMRATIADFTDDAVGKIKDYTKEAQDKIKSAVEEGKGAIAEKKSILASAIEAGREAMQMEKEKIARQK